ncbi:MAG: MobB family relaxase [Bacteroidota bacterium]
MYITITAQSKGGNFRQSVADFVQYLEKENEGLEPSGLDQTELPPEERKIENFFNQHEDNIPIKRVVHDIDSNTAKLMKKDPKFYSITVNPSQYELKRLENNSEDLKRYTRELMKEYAKSFNRTIDGRPVTVDDIVYYAKIEHGRSYKGTDVQVWENQPFANQILELKQEIRKIQRGETKGNLERLKLKIGKLEQQAPHRQNGIRIVQGMKKEGNQSHIHIIVSRKDASNRYSLSPGSKYKKSEVEMHGKKVDRGFDRERFFEQTEKVFDKQFAYERNFAERYRSRKLMLTDPKLYYSTILGLPANEKALALKILGKSGIPIMPHIPTNKVQLALRTIKALKRGAEVVVKSSSIGI